jgi:hypothetical protein
MKFFKITSIISCAIFLLLLQPAWAGDATEMEIKVSNGNSISVSRLNKTAKTSLLWLPSEHGQTSEDKKIARQLSKLGVDVWLADLLNSYFLIPAASSIKKIPVADISRLINQFLASDKKQKIVLASGRTAVVFNQNITATAVALVLAKREAVAHAKVWRQ